MNQEIWDKILSKILEVKLNPKAVHDQLTSELRALKTNNHIIKGHKKTINSVHASSDLTKIFSTSDDGTLGIWQFNSEHNDYVEYQKVELENDLDILTDILKVRFQNNQFLLGQAPKQPRIQFSHILKVSSDNSKIFMGMNDGKVQIHVLNKFSQLYERKGQFIAHHGNVVGMDISSDSNLIATCSLDTILNAKIWILDMVRTKGESQDQSLLKYSIFQQIGGIETPIYFIKFSSDLFKLFLGGQNGQLTIFKKEKLGYFNSLINSQDSQYEKHQQVSVIGQGALRCVDITSDNSIIAVGTEHHRIIVFKINKNGKKYSELQSLEGHRGSVRSIRVSDDSRLIVSSGDEHILKVWGLDQGTGKYFQQQILDGPSHLTSDGNEYYFTDIFLSRDKSKVIGASNEPEIKIWSLGEEVAQNVVNQEIIADLEQDIISFKLSRDGRYIYVGTSGGKLCIFKLQQENGKFEIYQTILTNSGSITSIYVPKDGAYIITGSSKSELNIYSTGHQPQDFKIIINLQIPNSHQIDFIKGFQNKNKFVYSTSFGTIAYAEIDMIKQEINILDEYFGDGRPLFSLQIARDSNQEMFLTANPYSSTILPRTKKTYNKLPFAEASIIGEIRIYRKSYSKEKFYLINKILSNTVEFTFGIFTNQGNQIMVGGSDGSIFTYKVKDYYRKKKIKLVSTLKAHSKPVRVIRVLDTNCNQIISTSQDRALIVWKKSTLNNQFVKQKEVFRHAEGYQGIDIPFDNKFVVSKGDYDRFLSVWALNSLNGGDYLPTTKISSSKNGYSQVQLSEDNTVLVANEINGPVSVYTQNQLNGNFELHQSIDFEPETDSEYIIQLSWDKEIIAFGTYSGYIHIWKFYKASGEYMEYQIMKNQYSAITCFDFSSDHISLVSGSQDQSIAVFQLNPLENEYFLEYTLKDHTSSIIQLKFSQDLTHLVSSAKDKSLIVWRKDETSKKKRFLSAQTIKNEERMTDFPAFDLSAKNELLIYGTDSGSMILMKFNSRKMHFEEIQKMVRHKSAISSLDFSLDHRTLVSASLDKSIRVWQFDRLKETYVEEQCFYGHSTRVCGVVLSNDWTKLFSASAGEKGVHEGTLKMWKKQENIFISDELTIRLNKVVSIKTRLNDKGVKITNIKFDKHDLKLLLLYLKNKASLDSVHGRIRILYLMVLSGFDDLLYSALESFSYMAWYYFETEFDPISLAIKLDNYVILNTIADYFKNNPDSHFPIGKNHLMKGLVCSSQQFRETIVSKFLVVGVGKGDIPKALSGNPQDFVIAIATDNFLKDAQFIEQVKREAKSKRGFSDQQKTKVRYLTSSFKMEVHLGSDFILEFLEQLTDAPPDVLKTDIKGVVKYLWSVYRSKMFLFSCVYWLFSMLLASNIVFCSSLERCQLFFSDPGWEDPERYYHVVKIVLYSLQVLIAVLYIFLIFYEVSILCRRGARYLGRGQIFIDFIVYIFFPLVFIQAIIGVEDKDDISNASNHKLLNFLTTIYIGCLGIRSMSYLRVIDGIRYLISMIFRVFIDVRYFVVVLIICIVTIGTIKIQIRKLGLEDGEIIRYQTFLKLLSETYVVGYGNYEDQSEYDWGRYFYFIVETFLLTLVMFNLLIAIVSSTFEDSLENKDITDIDELIQMMVDFGSFISVFYCSKKTSHKYLNVVLPLNDYYISKNTNFNLFRHF